MMTFQLTTKVPAQAENFSPAVRELLQNYFQSRGVDITPFYSLPGGFVNGTVAVREGKGRVNAEGIGFADNYLYVNQAFYNKYKSDPAAFTFKAIDAVIASLEKQKDWKNGYTVAQFNSDKAALQDIKAQLEGTKKIDRQGVPTKMEERITLEGNVTIPRWMHELYGKLKYEKKGIYLNEQTFAKAYAEYLKRRSSGEITNLEETFIDDLNLNRAHKRFYKVDFSNPDNLRVIDADYSSHGFGSDDGEGWVKSGRLSNVVSSNQSSEGVYIFKGTLYKEKYGGLYYEMDGRSFTNFLADYRTIRFHMKRGLNTAGCMDLAVEAALRLDLPLGTNTGHWSPQELKKRIDKLMGAMVFVYYDPNVQNVCKKYWKVP